VSEAQVIAWLDPTADNPLGDFSWEIWDPAVSDADVAILEINAGGDCKVEPWTTSSGGICVDLDVDGDPSVRILEGFCTTPDCVTLAQNTLVAEGNGSVAVAVPFSAADDGRDHWLSPGEPHCADCHAAPYTEQSGNINAFPPFNYPRKASLMRYSRGHQDISCQGCHESIHGLYPVTPTIDTTSYAQAANLNHDGTHGPVKCGGCHAVDDQGIPTWIKEKAHGTLAAITDFDSAVGWAHTYTDEDSVLTSTCLNCHGVKGNNPAWKKVRQDNEDYMEHASSDIEKDLPRSMMDKAETELYGAPFSTTDGSDGACQGCHGDDSDNVSCSDTEWKLHLTEGRVAESTWETASIAQTGSTCGW
jgi:mono/diheme cytochrome c family protein